MTATVGNARSMWRKPSRSVGNGACVEIGADEQGIAVRDTATPAGSVLRYSARAWRAFLIAVSKGKLVESQ